MRSLKGINIALLYGLLVFFMVWLYAISNTFTMGYYTPIPKKIAISIVAFTLAIVTVHRRTKVALIIAIVFVLLTWVPILILWILDRPGEWLKYYP